jgi:hypothetical protein
MSNQDTFSNNIFKRYVASKLLMSSSNSTSISNIPGSSLVGVRYIVRSLGIVTGVALSEVGEEEEYAANISTFNEGYLTFKSKCHKQIMIV